jgi:hypothetical protein
MSAWLRGASQHFPFHLKVDLGFTAVHDARQPDSPPQMAERPTILPEVLISAKDAALDFRVARQPANCL